MPTQLYLRDPAGNLKTIIRDFVRLEYARGVNKVGYLYLDLDPAQVDPSLFQLDCRIEPWRSVGVIPPYLDGETCYFYRGGSFIMDTNGAETLRLKFEDAIGLLSRRIVAYPAGDAMATATAVAADDLMKRIVSENFGADATDTARSIAGYMSIAANLTAAPVVTKEFSRRNVLKVLQEIAAESAQQGTPLFFDVVSIDGALEFRTYTGRRGNDHGRLSAQPVVISRERRNLEAPVISEDHFDEINFIYAGGRGQGEARIIKTATDAAAVGLSPLNRCEGWTDARNAEAEDAVQSEANTALEEGRYRRTLTGTILDTDGCLYGVHYRYGDTVYAEYRGMGYDAQVDTMNVVVQNGAETINNQVRAEE